MGEEEYNRILDELNTDSIATRIISDNYGKPIEYIYNLIEEAHFLNMSHRWFNGDVILVYPSFHERIASKSYITIHDACISINQLYVNYNALLINITSNTKFVLSHSLKFEVCDELPQSIMDLEDLERTTGHEIPLKRVKTKTTRK